MIQMSTYHKSLVKFVRLEWLCLFAGELSVYQKENSLVTNSFVAIRPRLLHLAAAAADSVSPTYADNRSPRLTLGTSSSSLLLNVNTSVCN